MENENINLMFEITVFVTMCTKLFKESFNVIIKLHKANVSHDWIFKQGRKRNAWILKRFPS